MRYIALLKAAPPSSPPPPGLMEWTTRFMRIHREHWEGWEGTADVLKVMGPEDFTPPAS